MKVINEKDYVYVKTDGRFYVFETNPQKKGFDYEMIHVTRVRFVRLDGSIKFYDYRPCNQLS